MLVAAKFTVREAEALKHEHKMGGWAVLPGYADTLSERLTASLELGVGTVRMAVARDSRSGFEKCEEVNIVGTFTRGLCSLRVGRSNWR